MPAECFETNTAITIHDGRRFFMTQQCDPFTNTDRVIIQSSNQHRYTEVTCFFFSQNVRLVSLELPHTLYTIHYSILCEMIAQCILDKSQITLLNEAPGTAFHFFFLSQMHRQLNEDITLRTPPQCYITMI